jgi:acyl-CoA thioester hydrolase
VLKEGVRYIFEQDIYRLPDRQLVIRARVDTVCLVHGRLSDCEELNEAFGKYFK